MHAFRLIGKFIEHARAASQSHPDLLRLPEPPLMDRFLLARVCEPISVTAGAGFLGAHEAGLDDSTAPIADLVRRWVH
jgi:hypothetical protein